MKQIILLMAAFAISMSGYTQVSEDRTTADFHEIHSSTGVHVYYTQSPEKSVKVETDSQEKLSRIATEVKKGKLKIYVKSNRGSKNNSFQVLKVYVSAPDVTEFEASSGSSIYFENGVETDSKVAIEVSSGAKINGDVTAGKLEIEVSSGSSYEGKIQAEFLEADVKSGSGITLSGSADRLDLEATSASKFKGKEFTARKAKVKATSTSKVEFTVTESLEAKASSLAKIDYYGNPTNVNTDTGSLGKINKR